MNNAHIHVHDGGGGTRPLRDDEALAIDRFEAQRRLASLAVEHGLTKAEHLAAVCSFQDDHGSIRTAARAMVEAAVDADKPADRELRRAQLAAFEVELVRALNDCWIVVQARNKA